MFNLLQLGARAHRAQRTSVHTTPEYSVRINEGLIDEISFGNIIDAILYARDQVCVTDAPIEVYNSRTKEMIQRIQ